MVLIKKIIEKKKKDQCERDTLTLLSLWNQEIISPVTGPLPACGGRKISSSPETGNLGRAACMMVKRLPAMCETWV